MVTSAGKIKRNQSHQPSPFLWFCSISWNMKKEIYIFASRVNLVSWPTSNQAPIKTHGPSDLIYSEEFRLFCWTSGSLKESLTLNIDPTELFGWGYQFTTSLQSSWSDLCAGRMAEGNCGLFRMHVSGPLIVASARFPNKKPGK